MLKRGDYAWQQNAEVIGSLFFFGNVVNNAEIEAATDGKKSYSRVRVAISETEGAIYIDIVLFDEYAQKMVPHLTRGKRIFVEGRMSANENNHISIIARDIQLLGDPQSKAES